MANFAAPAVWLHPRGGVLLLSSLRAARGGIRCADTSARSLAWQSSELPDITRTEAGKCWPSSRSGCEPLPVRLFAPRIHLCPGLLESPNGMQTRQISNAGHRPDPPGWAEAQPCPIMLIGPRASCALMIERFHGQSHAPGSVTSIWKNSQTPSAAKDPAERSDTCRVAGARSFASLRTTGSDAAHSIGNLTRSMLFDDSSGARGHEPGSRAQRSLAVSTSAGTGVRPLARAPDTRGKPRQLPRCDR